MEWAVEMSKFPLPPMPTGGLVLYISLPHALLLFSLLPMLLCVVCCVLFMCWLYSQISFMLSIFEYFLSSPLHFFVLCRCCVVLVRCVFHGFDFGSGWVRLFDVGFSFGV